ncbi:uncharacterized protein LTR77_006543 [Saxophila tyrrhenica]|uniref:Uncharacterized protein n=1 Tax=Saxophila tyrrhenica TaxID=1690608 RepID=A0AAV9P5R3_9PEZI|nr:hypothetical protein LTR77_006543 [Saxophila tyrrhenica]
MPANSDTVRSSSFPNEWRPASARTQASSGDQFSDLSEAPPLRSDHGTSSPTSTGSVYSSPNRPPNLSELDLAQPLYDELDGIDEEVLAHAIGIIRQDPTTLNLALQEALGRVINQSRAVEPNFALGRYIRDNASPWNRENLHGSKASSSITSSSVLEHIADLFDSDSDMTMLDSTTHAFPADSLFAQMGTWDIGFSDQPQQPAYPQQIVIDI